MKYNVYYTIQKKGERPITKYYLIDAKNKQQASNKAKQFGKKWEATGYLFTVTEAVESQGFYI